LGISRMICRFCEFEEWFSGFAKRFPDLLH
jgi:hypothetical protein